MPSFHLIPSLALSAAFALVAITQPLAATDCSWTDVDTTRYLDNDCTTDETLVVPNGFTFDGRGFLISAVDPVDGHFTGAVLRNGGDVAHFTDIIISATELSNICNAAPSPDRLMGIQLEDTSGSITHSTVENINQGASGCQEGNAIDVRSSTPTDEGLPRDVLISHNVIGSYQKTGIVCDGMVSCEIRHNIVGQSATQDHLAANAVQISRGATGTVSKNHISGNQWGGPSEFVATAVLALEAGDLLDISLNNVGGNADVGIFLFATSGATVNNNRIFEKGPDAQVADVGLADLGTDNTITNNKTRGYAFPAIGESIIGLKVIPSPHDPTACFQTCP